LANSVALLPLPAPAGFIASWEASPPCLSPPGLLRLGAEGLARLDAASVAVRFRPPPAFRGPDARLPNLPLAAFVPGAGKSSRPPGAASAFNFPGAKVGARFRLPAL